MLCTITDVKQASSLFRNNTNIGDQEILNKIQMAESTIISRVGRKYTIPLGKWYENTITFSGTGSGTGTMTITINGVDYTVSITSGLSAIDAADLFRTSASSSGDFVVNGLYSDEIVILNNQTANSSAEITISTSTQTVSGITATNGNLAEVGIPFLRVCCAELASGYLLLATLASEDDRIIGHSIIKNVMSKLAEIDLGQMKLFDFVGVELPYSSSNLIETYPNSSSSDDADNPTARVFKVNDKL